MHVKWISVDYTSISIAILKFKKNLLIFRQIWSRGINIEKYFQRPNMKLKIGQITTLTSKEGRKYTASTRKKKTITAL